MNFAHVISVLLTKLVRNAEQSSLAERFLYHRKIITFTL